MLYRIENFLVLPPIFFTRNCLLCQVGSSRSLKIASHTFTLTEQEDDSKEVKDTEGGIHTCVTQSLVG